MTAAGGEILTVGLGVGGGAVEGDRIVG